MSLVLETFDRLLIKDFEEHFSSTSSMPAPNTFPQLDESARKTCSFRDKRSDDGLFQQPVKNDDIRLGMVSPLLWLPPVVQEAFVPIGV